MKLSKSLYLLSLVYLVTAIIVLISVVMLINIDSASATRLLQTDLVIFLMGAILSHSSDYCKRYEKWARLYRKEV